MLFFKCMLMRKLDSTAKRSITPCKIDSSNVKNMFKICLWDIKGSFQTLHRVLLWCSLLYPAPGRAVNCLPGRKGQSTPSLKRKFGSSLPAFKLVPSPAKSLGVFQWPHLNFYFILVCCFGIWRTLNDRNNPFVVNHTGGSTVQVLHVAYFSSL